MERSETLQSHRIDVSCSLPVNYAESRPAQEARQLILFLHGYEQDGRGLLLRCESVLPPDAHAVAPDGLFPLPRKIERTYRMGYSWYFYNPYTDQYAVDPSYGVGFLKALLAKVNPGRLPVTLVGFSQGGYIAPFVAAEVPEVKRIIGMGCQFLDDEIDLKALASRPVRMDALHGAMDEIASPEDAQRSHEALRKAGVQGEFHLLAETGHRVDLDMRARLGTLLNANAQEKI